MKTLKPIIFMVAMLMPTIMFVSCESKENHSSSAKHIANHHLLSFDDPQDEDAGIIHHQTLEALYDMEDVGLCGNFYSAFNIWYEMVSNFVFDNSCDSLYMLTQYKSLYRDLYFNDERYACANFLLNLSAEAEFLPLSYDLRDLIIDESVCTVQDFRDGLYNLSLSQYHTDASLGLINQMIYISFDSELFWEDFFDEPVVDNSFGSNVVDVIGAFSASLSCNPLLAGLCGAFASFLWEKSVEPALEVAMEDEDREDLEEGVEVEEADESYLYWRN